MDGQTALDYAASGSATAALLTNVSEGNAGSVAAAAASPSMSPPATPSKPSGSSAEGVGGGAETPPPGGVGGGAETPPPTNPKPKSKARKGNVYDRQNARRNDGGSAAVSAAAAGSVGSSPKPSPAPKPAQKPAIKAGMSRRPLSFGNNPDQGAIRIPYGGTFSTADVSYENSTGASGGGSGSGSGSSGGSGARDDGTRYKYIDPSTRAATDFDAPSKAGIVQKQSKLLKVCAFGWGLVCVCVCVCVCACVRVCACVGEYGRVPCL